MPVGYVDNSLHAAANAEGVAAGGGSDHVLLADSGVQADGEFDGYGISVTAGAGAGQHRRIAAYQHTGHPLGERCAQVEPPWAEPPGAGSSYEITVGCDLNSGANAGPGSAGAWRGLDRAMNWVASAGTGAKQIYVKAGRAYRETVTIYTPGAQGQPVIVEGYAETPGDGGESVIDGESVRSFGFTTQLSDAISYALRNIAVVNCTSHGFDLGTAALLRLVNCRAENNGGGGIRTSGDSILLGCRASGNALDGFTCLSGTGTSTSLLVDCVALANGGHQFKPSSAVLLFCKAAQLADNKAAVATFMLADSAYLINCTIDGTGSSGAIGLGVQFSPRSMAINTLFTNLSRGIHAPFGDALRLARNNLFFNCSAGNIGGFADEGGNLEADPHYVNLAELDLRLMARSPALRAGYPQYLDMGSHQHEARTTLGGPCLLGMQA